MKWFVFDNKVIFTGANLHHSYFIDRQDRYVVIHDAQQIADYIDDAQEALMQHSFQIDDVSDYLIFPKDYSPPTRRKKYFEEFLQTWKIFEFSHQNDIQSSLETELSEDDIKESDTNIKESDTREQEEKFTEEQEEKISQQEIQEMYQRDIEISKQLNERKDQARKLLEASFDEGDVQNIVNRLEKALYSAPQHDSETGEDVHLFITFNLPYLQTTHDQKMMKVVFEYLSEHPELNVCLTSGYLNLHKGLFQAITNLKNQIKLITAGPDANGFHKAGKLKSFIPFFYRSYEINILEKGNKNIELYEYEKPGWTYHSKGLWIDQPDDNYFTIIGSSNYSNRSLKRDSEIQVYMYSKCPSLKKDLIKEQENFLRDSKPKTLNDLKNDKEVNVSLTTRILGRIFSTFL